MVLHHTMCAQSRAPKLSHSGVAGSQESWGGGAIEPLKRPLPIVAHLTKFGCSSTHGVSVVTYMQMWTAGRTSEGREAGNKEAGQSMCIILKLLFEMFGLRLSGCLSAFPHIFYTCPDCLT